MKAKGILIKEIKKKDGRGRPKGIPGKPREIRYAFPSGSIVEIRRYMARLVKKIEEEVVKPIAGNTIINACRLMMECLDREQTRVLVEEKMARLEKLIGEIREQRNNERPGWVGEGAYFLEKFTGEGKGPGNVNPDRPGH